MIPTIPPLAGLCSYDEAHRTGLSVENCVDWLKRLHYVWKRLHQIFTAHITAEPLYELKTAFSLHSHLCAEHAQAIRTRVSEMREPPLGLEVIPHPGLEQACDEVLCAPTTYERCLGLYQVLLPALNESIHSYLETTNRLADAPSVRILRFAQLELHDILAFGDQVMSAWEMAPDTAVAYYQGLWQALASAGGLSGRDAITTSSPAPVYSVTPFQYDRVPRRDERFQDSFNAGVNPEAFLYDPRYSPRDKTLMMYYKRIREIDVPEMMASILIEMPDKPWGFQRDMTRQLWDEARHAMLGEVGFRQAGIDWTQIPISFLWSYNLNTQLNATERHAVLFFIEQGLMPKTGKRFEWEVGRASGDELSALFQDFDWADEVLHAQIGREWYVKGFGDLNSALAYGDACWSKVMSHWREYRDQGLTQHRNWWPEIYQRACHHWGVPTDPLAMAYCETYESIRADLKEITGSA
ncbi:MAG: hypothetical protein DWH91_06850 [Planctomycetota bacterium]|nr:MAG: hypothetical protein DWH91_06850 [Planctomycetota bacterium]